MCARLSPAGLLTLVALGLAAGACLSMLNPVADEWTPPGLPAVAPAERAPREPCADRDPLKRALFGDLHVHTANSMDARSRDTLGTANDAYRFATGETIGVFPYDRAGQPLRSIQIDRPLDFAAVTDHAEWIGEVALCTRVGSPSYDSEGCRTFRGEGEAGLLQFLLPSLLSSRVAGVIGLTGRRGDICGDDDVQCRAMLGQVWREQQAINERWYDRTSACRFTTFHAWEYSASPGRSKAHRNVVLRNEIVPELPISWLDQPEALGLWAKLDERCNATGSGCEAIAIPHNPNLSNGRLFTIDDDGVPPEERRRRAELRARIEPLVEITQIKGDSECRNGLAGVVGGEDELCDYEKIRRLQETDDCNGGTGSGALMGKGCQSRLDFVRYALVEGLVQQQRIGVNPYAVGLIGSSDTHNANPGDVEESSYPGCCAVVDDTPAKRITLAGPTHGVLRNPGGLVGVWAEENSRDAIFDALKRRETFATSGPRIQPRLFAGWDRVLPEDLCDRGDFAARGYAHGVPMGSDLPAPPPNGGDVRIAQQALRDTGRAGHPGGKLQRLQIVKGWVGDDGATHQAIYDVAGDSASTASVDLATCEPQGRGADSLCSVWTDPDFDPSRPAVYYGRIVENPSCRWTMWQCLQWPEAVRPALCDDPRVPRTIQERAWTSPVWYTPRDEPAPVYNGSTGTDMAGASAPPST